MALMHWELLRRGCAQTFFDPLLPVSNSTGNLERNGAYPEPRTNHT